MEDIWRYYIQFVCIIALVKGHSDPLDNIQLVIFDESAHVPGEPLTPIDYQNAETVHDSPPPTDQYHSDPIEIAGLFEGDIILTSTAKDVLNNSRSEDYSPKNAIISENQKWRGGVIPYFISSQFNNVERSVIAKAISEYHKKTCITFKPRTTESDYIHITKGNGCSSHVGRSGGAQPVTLGQGCVYTGIAIHELMHAVGFWHEQSRWDRDDFVTVYFQNIQSGMEFNFRKYSWKNIQNLSAPYDVSSVMHYGSYAFSKDRRSATILPKDPNQKLGQRDNFSKIDLLKINRLYKCGGGGGGSTPEPVTTKPQPTTGCQDNHKHCDYWSKKGECSKNKVWMLANCKKSCKQCRSCGDLNQYCGVWARKGDCSRNAVYMKSYCAKSCKSCRTHGISGTDGPSTVKTTTTPTNPIFSTTTLNPHLICEDKEKYCAYWASTGECAKNSKFMGKYCPKSCKIC